MSSSLNHIGSKITLAAALLVAACSTPVDEMVDRIRDAVYGTESGGATGCNNARQGIIGALGKQGFTQDDDGRLTLRATGNHLHVNVHNSAHSAISDNPKDGAIWIDAVDTQGKEAFKTRLTCTLP